MGTTKSGAPGPVRHKKKTALTEVSNIAGIALAVKNKRTRVPSRKAKELIIAEDDDTENRAPEGMENEMEVELEKGEEAELGTEAPGQETGERNRGQGGPQESETEDMSLLGLGLGKEVAKVVAKACGEALRALQKEITGLKGEVKEAKEMIKDLEEQVQVLNSRLSIEVTQRTTQPVTSTQMTYAAAAASAKNGSNAVVNIAARRRVAPAAPSARPPIFCTVETAEEGEAREKLPTLVRQGVETAVRAETKDQAWKCMAVIRDARNHKRIRVMCRTEEELAVVKRAAEKAKPDGARALRDQLHPVKMDNVVTRAILTSSGSIRDDAVTNIEAENGVKIAKIAWLSSRVEIKEYGSMAVYFTKEENAAEALQNGFFTVAGESALTRPFLPRIGPQRCYKCQQVGHKAYSCKGTETCAHCAQTGHNYHECRAEIPKCAVCGGPHGAFSKRCQQQRAPPLNLQ